MELVVNPQELILDHWNTQYQNQKSMWTLLSSRMIEPAKMPEKKKYFFDVGKENPVPTTFSCGDSKTLKHAKWEVEDITDMRITNGRIDYFVKWAPDLLGNFPTRSYLGSSHELQSYPVPCRTRKDEIRTTKVFQET